MKRLRCLFIVQGEGRGHLTQALASDAMLSRAGHSVCTVIVSRGGDTEAPAYFEQHLDAPLEYVEGVHFVVDGSSRSIQWMQTLAMNKGRWRHFQKSFDVIDQCLQRSRPDVIVNFYEPLGGLFMMRHNPGIPMVAVAHQFMLLHPDYVLPEGFQLQRRATTLFTRLAGLRASRRLALSLFDAERLPSQQLHVTPPLLRDELLALPIGVEEQFFLIYLFHHSLSEAVIAWHQRNPSVALHCFWHKPGAEEITVYDDTLTFHQLHGHRFLEMMARSRGVITTSGFESTAEAMFLGKPLLLIPLKGHFEQHCNGLDGVRSRAAVQADDYDLDKLLRFLPEYRFDATGFRAWVKSAETLFVKHIEDVARGKA